MFVERLGMGLPEIKILETTAVPVGLHDSGPSPVFGNRPDTVVLPLRAPVAFMEHDGDGLDIGKWHGGEEDEDLDFSPIVSLEIGSGPETLRAA